MRIVCRLIALATLVWPIAIGCGARDVGPNDASGRGDARESGVAGEAGDMDGPRDAKVAGDAGGPFDGSGLCDSEWPTGLDASAVNPELKCPAAHALA